MKDEEGRELEQRECPGCGGLPSLKETCGQCNGLGRILSPVRPGHETLSAMRRKMQDKPGRYGEDPNNPRTGPSYTDPLWVGTEAP